MGIGTLTCQIIITILNKAKHGISILLPVVILYILKPTVSNVGHTYSRVCWPIMPALWEPWLFLTTFAH